MKGSLNMSSELEIETSKTLWRVTIREALLKDVCRESIMSNINTIEILKGASSKYLLNDTIAGQNDEYKNFFPHQ